MTLSKRTFQHVLALLDWNSQLRQSSRATVTQQNEFALRSSAARISKCLNSISTTVVFRVSMRLYNGWHKGFEPSANRRAIQQVLASTDFSNLSRFSNVIFSDAVAYGDTLLLALESRRNSSLRNHLPNTLRERDKTTIEEKMVDTALAGDMLSSAVLNPEDWILVLSEDDDLVPPIYTAEALLSGQGSKVLLLRSRPASGKYLNLTGICV